MQSPAVDTSDSLFEMLPSRPYFETSLPDLRISTLVATPVMEKIKETSNEVWLLALGGLAKKDLQSLRLACRPVEDIAASLLFRTVFIAPRRDAADVFFNLITHPRFRHYVRTIVCDRSWIDLQKVKVGKRLDYDRRRGFDRLYRDQEYLLNQQLEWTLIVAFKNLTRLSPIVFEDLSRKAGAPGDQVNAEGELLIY